MINVNHAFRSLTLSTDRGRVPLEEPTLPAASATLLCPVVDRTGRGRACWESRREINRGQHSLLMTQDLPLFLLSTAAMDEVGREKEQLARMEVVSQSRHSRVLCVGAFAVRFFHSRCHSPSSTQQFVNPAPRARQQVSEKRQALLCHASRAPLTIPSTSSARINKAGTASSASRFKRKRRPPPSACPPIHVIMADRG